MQIAFSTNGQTDYLEMSGVSVPEPHGLWTLGPESRLAFEVVDAEESIGFNLVVSAHIAPQIPMQRLRVFLNDHLVIEEDLGVHIRELSWFGSRDMLRLDGRNEIRLSHPDAFAPVAVGTSGDGREMAVLLRYIDLTGFRVPPPPVVADEAPPPGTRQFHVVTQGRQGNQIIQYFVARRVQSLVPGCALSNLVFPHWGIDEPAAERLGRRLDLNHPYVVDLPAIAAAFESGQYDTVVYSGFGQNIDYFLDAETYRSEMLDPPADVRRFGADELLVSVRSGEIVDPINPHYTLIPIAFYELLARTTGLRLVFMGQVDPNFYTDRLRAAFPDAEFVASEGPLRDFDMIRAASNICLSVSTFSWAAAWISRAAKVFLPVTGFYNPMQEPRINLLPLDDPRYRFFLFPYNQSASRDDVFALHDAIAPFIREVPPNMLRRLRDERPRFARDIEDYVAVFDAAVYAEGMPALDYALSQGLAASPEEHYRAVGYDRGVPCFRLDPTWYVTRYPLAAFEVGQGDFQDLMHHYVAVGRQRGYLPHC